MFCNVLYDIRRCLEEDRNPSKDDTNGVGHNSIICSLLQLCTIDEDEEDEMIRQRYKSKDKKDDDDNNNNKNKKNKKNNNQKEEARDRIKSEYESYPATLANIIMDGPCYQSILKQNNELTIHIIGASNEAELWNAFESDSNRSMNYYMDNDVFDSYTEACTEMMELNGIHNMNILFIGPSCPSKNKKVKRQLLNSKKSQIHFYTFASKYNHEFLHTLSSLSSSSSLKEADIIVFFNPGFTCPDYHWEDALSCIPNKSDGIPFLITTNTEMEAMLDCEYLLERHCISSLPTMMKENEEEEDDDDDDEDNEDQHEGSYLFLSQNPYAGSRIRQSGTMANDLFIKNMWMYGGSSLSRPKSNKKRNYHEHKTKNENKKKSKNYVIVGKGNSKKKNPALI